MHVYFIFAHSVTIMKYLIYLKPIYLECKQEK